VIDLYHGDCLDILPALPDGCADAIITDLPYGTTACKWDVIIPFDAMWKQVKRLCKGAFVTTASQPFTSALIGSNFEWFKHDVVWDKVNHANFMLAKIEPLEIHESVVVFGKGKITYNPQMTDGAMSLFGKRTTSVSEHHSALVDNGKHGLGYPKSILRYPKPNNLSGGGLHPTQKPVALYEYLIKTYTNPGDTVLDFCMGSGTTIVAAIRTGRNAIGIEKEAPYFDMAQRRMKEQQMELINA
jgi:site-specific DNA-methyltransferase (adenine-specific)